MRIFPAIDIIDGCVVRLYKGDYAMAEVYDVDFSGDRYNRRVRGAPVQRRLRNGRGL